MTVNYLPGRPTASEESVSFVNWHNLSILAYCSGNNLIVITKNFESLQTIYLKSEAKCCDVNKQNGKIAVSIGSSILVYKPVIKNYYDYTFYTDRKDVNVLEIYWQFELEMLNSSDETQVNCINWSDSCDSFELEDDGEEMSRSGTPINGGIPQEEFETETSAELVVGSDRSLTLWRLFYKDKRSHSEKKLTCVRLWFKRQASPVFSVKLSPDTNFIASCGKFDKLVKIWRRLTFGIESAEFDLSYAKHPDFVTSFRWRTKSIIKQPTVSRAPSSSNNLPSSNGRFDSVSLMSSSAAFKGVNVLYTYCMDNSMRIFSSFEADSKHITQYQGSLNVNAQNDKLKQPFFLSVIDNEVFEYGLSLALNELSVPEGVDKSLKETEKVGNTLKVPKVRYRSDSSNSFIQEREIKLTQLLARRLEIAMIIDCTGLVEFYLLENISQYPPTYVKMTKIKNNQSIKLSPNTFPKNPRFLSFQNFIVSRYYDSNEKSFDYTLSLVFHDLEKGTIRHVEFLFDSIIDCLLTMEHPESSKEAGIDDDEAGFLTTSKENTNGSACQFIGSLQHKYSGHDKSIQKLRRSIDGTALLSLSRFGEAHLWTPTHLGHQDHTHKHHMYYKENSKHLHFYNGTGVTLSRTSLIKTAGAITDAIVFNDGGRFVLTLSADELILWDCRLDNRNTKVAKEKVVFETKSRTSPPLTFFILPEKASGVFHAVAVYSLNDLESWEVVINEKEDEYTLSSFSVATFPADQGEIHLISAIDPVGWDNKLSDFSNMGYKYDVKLVQQRDVLSIIDTEGNLRIYSTTMDKDHTQILWYLKSHNMTNITNALYIKGSSINKCAIVNSTQQKLSIWDTKTNFLEYEEDFPNKIHDLDWTCTNKNDVSILAVTFDSAVLLYTQLRYDYTNETPSYAAIRSIDISSTTTHNIGDSIWLTDGTLVIGSGNQFYIADKYLDVANDRLSQRVLGSSQIVFNDIFTAGMVVNGILPYFHPQFLIQSLFLEKFDDVKEILAYLYYCLRDIELDPNGNLWRDILVHSEVVLESFLSNIAGSGIFSKGESTSGFVSKYDGLFNDQNENTNRERKVFNKQVAQALTEMLQKVKLPFLTRHQQITLVSVIEIVDDIDTNYKSVLDSNGLRYYLGLKLYQLNASKTGFEGTISLRDISFALHSENKDLLFNIVNDVSHSELNWTVAKNYGLVYWLSNYKLSEQFEKIARNEFLRRSDENQGLKDPSTCSIFYLALKKKQILISLWKISTGNHEQQKMLKFLSNDFKEKRWKTAALKNAFALLSKHRYMDAANFFLLGDSLKDCVNVIMKQLNDIDLAIGVARCYESSDNGPVFQYILKEHLLPSAIDSNDRWLKSYVYHELKQHKNSIQSLIDDDFDDKQVFPTTSLTVEATKKSFLEYDPVLIVLYHSLRKSGISSSNEYRFITKITKIYNRMGCDVLSLYIVKNWKFNYGQLDELISNISSSSKDESNNTTSNITLINDLELGGTEVGKKRFVEPPKSLDFNMDAFDF